MKLLFTQESDFRRERDFGNKISATFDFLSSQFKPFLKCLAYFVLPGALLVGIGMSLFMSRAVGFYSSFNAARQGGGNAMGSVDPLMMYRGWGGLGVGLTIVGGLLTVVLLSGTVYSYMRVRLHLPATETVQPRQVWDWLRPRLGRMVLACLLLIVLLVGALIVLALVIAGITALNIGGWGVLLFIGLYVVNVWLAGCLALYFPVMWLEDLGPLRALSRCFSLIRGKWWSTFGLIMVMAIIQSSMSYMFAIPMYAMMMTDVLQLSKTGVANDSSLMMQAATLLYAGGSMLLLALPLLALGFQYFNLVERRDSVGARQQLALLGQTAAPEVENRFYQPDEEGEY